MLYLLGIGIAYHWPPVMVRNFSQAAYPDRTVLIAELAVSAPFAVRLTGVEFHNGADPLTAEAVQSSPGQPAAAGAGAEQLWQMQGAVAGWKVPPTDGRQPDHGVRMTFAPDAKLPGTILVKYRYLGWAFQTEQSIAWNMQAQSAAAAGTASSPGTVLHRLCVKGEASTPELIAAAEAEVTAAVREAGADPIVLQLVLARLSGESAEPMALRADADGDGAPDLLVAFGFCQTPVLVYRAAEPGKPVSLPTGASLPWMYGGGSRIDQVADVNGDGRPEVVMERRVAGGSADHTYLFVYQWYSGFSLLFEDQLSNWRGPNRWTVGDGTVSIQCRPLGPFEHKMTPNRQQTEKFRWNPATIRYELVDRAREPVETQLQQISDAEELFQTGNYDDALLAYSQVGRFKAPAQPEADWPALAALRTGQMLALKGRRNEALAALQLAAEGAAPVGEMAAAFLTAYRSGDEAHGFAAYWDWIQKHYGGADWPFMLDKPTLGARRAMLEAFTAAGRPAPAGLPDPTDYKPPACLSITY